MWATLDIHHMPSSVSISQLVKHEVNKLECPIEGGVEGGLRTKCEFDAKVRKQHSTLDLFVYGIY